MDSKRLIARRVRLSVIHSGNTKTHVAASKCLEEISLYIEIVLNNQTLIYTEDKTQMPVLTPSTLLYGQSIIIPEERLDNDSRRETR